MQNRPTHNFLNVFGTLLLVMLTSMVGSAQNYFSKVVDDTTGEELPNSILPVDDGFILVAQSLNYTPLNDHRAVTLYKVDTAANVQWKKLIHPPNTHTFWGTGGGSTQLADGNFATAYAIQDSNTAQTDFFLVKFDGQGDTVFTRRFGSNRPDDATAVTYTADSGMIMAGWGRALDPDGDVYLTKFDMDGNQVWARFYGGLEKDYAYNIRTLDGKEFYVSGKKTIAGNEDCYIMKIDSAGNMLWDKTLGGPGFDCHCSIDISDSGKLLVAGCRDTVINNEPMLQTTVYLLDTAGGSLVWVREVVAPEYNALRYRVKPLPGNKGFILVGRVDDKAIVNGLPLGYLAQIDNQGNFTYFRRYGYANDLFLPGFASTYFNDVAVINDGLMVLGEANGTNGTQDLWLVKLDSLGCIGDYCGLTDTNCYYLPYPDCDTTSDTVSIHTPAPSAADVQLYPNPAYSSITVKVPFNGTLEVFSPFGEQVLSQFISSKTTTISLNGLSGGMYLYRFVPQNPNSNTTRQGKLIKLE